MKTLVTTFSALLVLCTGLAQGAEPTAQYVRISLTGENRILTLAEVEVISDGKNIAKEGKASQSSTANNGVAERAIDGNKSSDWGKGGQTHTVEKKGKEEPWWELDLGSAKPIEKIEIWNRSGLYERLQGFNLELLDADKNVVYEHKNNPAPDGSISFQFGDGMEIAMADHDGKAVPVPILLQSVPEGYRDPSPFEFQKGDKIAIIGNGLADRMQHDGWMETYLQMANTDKELVFRNLSLTGDRVDHYPRSKGFMPMEEYLRHVEADVIFAFFGYNESFAGAAGLEEFETKLAEMIEKYRGVMPNGESFPRLVIFSPIAHENLEDPNLPDGEENNKRLALYTAGMQKVAHDEGVTFVDLFGPTKKLYEEIEEPLTINGVHLNELGNKHLGDIITQALCETEIVEAAGQFELMRGAILDKNWHWHNRYRAVDGNDIWGGRSTLKFVNDQTNAEVLQHELTMLDVMTANRDPLIWARANGSDWKVDDSNVPEPVKVISNVGGGSKSSSAEKEGNLDYISGEEGIAHMTMPEGFEVNLFADEKMFPELVNPVQMQVDSKGRLWVAAWKTYPKWEPLKEMDDALLILTDTDGDGKADSCKEFARVHNPLGFEFWNGGVIVTSQPDILFLKDTDGDDVADERYVIFQGIGSSDTHHSANNLIMGPDGGIYWQSGVFLQHNHEHPWGPSLEASASAMYRFDPRRYTIAFHAPNSPNPHGIAFDRWGYHYANDGTGGRSYQVRPSEDGFDMHQLLVKEVRPVPADEIVSSTNFPDEMQQNFLVCNTIGFLGIKNYKLHRDGYKTTITEKRGQNVTEKELEFALGEVWGTPEEDLLVSDDKNFRPTDAVFGEDGALYVSDWHNVIIGHMQHNIRDPNRDHKHGRVYRMVYTKNDLQKPVAIDGQPVAALLENFKSPVDGVRHRTRVELSERDAEEVIDQTKKWVATLDPKSEGDAIPLLEALWVHQQFNIRDRDLLDTVLNSPNPHVAIAAKTVKHHWDVADPAKNVQTTPIEQEEEKIEIDIPEHFTKAEAEVYKLGAEVFHRDAHCVTCHQATGQGIVNIYPPLIESSWVTGSEERLIKIALHGLWGPIEVNGKHYDPSKGVPPMTAFKALLDDKEMAAVLTFVRNSWGNKASIVKPETVKKVREETASQQIFYKPEELLKDHPLE